MRRKMQRNNGIRPSNTTLLNDPSASILRLGGLHERLDVRRVQRCTRKILDKLFGTSLRTCVRRVRVGIRGAPGGHIQVPHEIQLILRPTAAAMSSQPLKSILFDGCALLAAAIAACYGIGGGPRRTPGSQWRKRLHDRRVIIIVDCVARGDWRQQVGLGASAALDHLTCRLRSVRWCPRSSFRSAITSTCGDVDVHSANTPALDQKGYAARRLCALVES